MLARFDNTHYVVANAFVGVNFAQEQFSVVFVLRPISKMDAPALIHPPVNFCRIEQQQRGYQREDESGHTVSFHSGVHAGCPKRPVSDHEEPLMTLKRRAMNSSQWMAPTIPPC